MNKILEIKNLTATIGGKTVIDNVDLELHNGNVLALVGESGSGKTLTALSILDLLPKGVLRKGTIQFRGKNIFDLDRQKLREIRGKDIAMVFQEPFTALNPVMRIGEQISEVIIVHNKIWPRGRVESRIKELLDMVELSPGIMSHYPHEISGGMRQRVMLAIALSCDPDILILDEPTTALDVSIQKRILDLIKRIQRENRFAALFITHDFSVVNMIADEVCVMREGHIIERGNKDEVLTNPKHAYTNELIECIPRLGDKRRRLPVYRCGVRG